MIPILRDPSHIQEEYSQLCAHIGDTVIKLRRIEEALRGYYARVQELEVEMQSSQKAVDDNGDANGNVLSPA